MNKKTKKDIFADVDDDIIMPPKKRLNKSDIILIAMGITLVIFIITMIIIYCFFQSVPDTLIVSVFAIFTGECGIMGMLKHSDNKYIQNPFMEQPTITDVTTDNEVFMEEDLNGH